MIDYISLAGTYYTDYGTFGLGYVGANVSGSFVTGLTFKEDRGIILPVVTAEPISYTSSVMLISYGVEAKKYLNYDFLNDVSLGASFKIFSQGLTGGGITDGTLNGYDMDLGALYKPMPQLSFGLMLMDAMPTYLIDNSGERQHSMPMITKLGMAFKVLGPKDSWTTYSTPLTYLLDFDLNSSAANYPMIMHTGAEWWPSDYLALRFGLDQDIIGTDATTGFVIETNMAAGVGVYYGGFIFDYSYRKYGIQENDTTYLSLAYAAPFDIAPPKKEEKLEYLNIISPKDKSIVYDESVVIKGEVYNLNEVTSLEINGTIVPFVVNSPYGTFEATYPLSFGKNKFKVVAMAKEKVLASTEVRILRLAKFKDVQTGFWTREPIEFLATLGIIGGYPDATFRPNKVINRAELTTLLVKARGISSTETVASGFIDVPLKHWASFYIKNGVELGLVTGYPDKTFKPSKFLNRAEGVTILSRFAGLTEPESITVGPFLDVPGRHWAAKSITAARSAGMLLYLLNKKFEPSKEMTRAEAAEILGRTPFAIEKINELKDFNTY